MPHSTRERPRAALLPCHRVGFSLDRGALSEGLFHDRVPALLLMRPDFPMTAGLQMSLSRPVNNAVRTMSAPLSFNRLTRMAILTLSALPMLASLTACQRGEKSCRYYSLVLEKSESAEDRKSALDAIKKLNTKDQQKCNDDRVFERLGKAMAEPKYRPLVIETVENVGRAGGKLRERSEKLLLTGLSTNEAASQIATTFRTWRLESMDTSDPWKPGDNVATALAAAIKRVTQGSARAPLVEALFLCLSDADARAKYEDLLIELADTDPAQQTVDVNIKAMQYLGEMRSAGDAAFAAYIHGLYQRDAVRAETYGAARIALAVVPKQKVADKLMGIYTQKDPAFEEWSKKAGLFPWEWQEGPKAMQVFADLHLPSTASALLASIAKPLDVSEDKTPATFKIVNKALPWAGYVTSRIQLSTWAFAAMGEGLAPIASEIAAVGKNANLAREQRVHPALGLAFSGASNAWPTLLDIFKASAVSDRGEFLPALAYAVDTAHLGEWTSVVAADKEMAGAIADPTIAARIKVVEECKKQEDAATDKPKALFGCYAGFLKSGDAVAKEKAANMLIQLGAKGQPAVIELLGALERSTANDVTLRQIAMAGIKSQAKPDVELMKAIYHTQQLMIQDLPAAQPWIWDFDILLAQLAGELKGGAPKLEAPKGEAPKAEAPKAEAPKAEAPKAP